MSGPAPLAIVAKISTAPSDKLAYKQQQLDLGEQDVTDRATNITSSRSVVQDVVVKNQPDTNFLLKYHDPDTLDRDSSPHRINPMQVETATANLFRLLSPTQCANTYSVIDANGIASKCIIEKKAGLQTVQQLISEASVNYSNEQLLEMGIAPLLIYHFLLENNDCRIGNIGVHDGKFFAFDFDRALWGYPTCALIRKEDFHLEPGQSFDVRKFDLSLCDLQQFPNIKDAAPDQWPTRLTTGNDELAQRSNTFANSLINLQKDANFTNEKYYYFFKFSILFNCRKLIEDEVAKAISPNTQEFDLTVTNLQQRAEQLRFKLLEDQKFEPYHGKLNHWFQCIRKELLPEHTNNNNNEQAIQLSFDQFEALLAEKELINRDEIKQKSNDAAELNQTTHGWKRKSSLSSLSISDNNQLQTQHADEQQKHEKNSRAEAIGAKLQSLFKKNQQHVNKLNGLFLANSKNNDYNYRQKKSHRDFDLYNFSHALHKACQETENQNKQSMLAYTLRRMPKIKSRLFGNSRFHKDMKKFLKSQEFKQFKHAFTQQEQHVATRSLKKN